MRHIIGSIIKANKIFKMIENNDRIIVGVSGGKDSLTLLLCLIFYAKKVKQELNWNIKIKAFLIDIGFKKTNFCQLKKFFKQNNISFEIITSDIAQILKKFKKQNKIQCSFCSRMKKAILTKIAIKQKFNKIAFGHHIDDAIETLFMNILNEGRIETFKPITYLSKTKIYLIRPLILCHEKEIIAFAKKKKLPIISNQCPNNFSSQRTMMKKFIEENFYANKIWPNSYKTIYKSVCDEIITKNKK